MRRVSPGLLNQSTRKRVLIGKLPPEGTGPVMVQVGVGGGQASWTSSQTGGPPRPLGQVVAPGQRESSGLGQGVPGVQVGPMVSVAGQAATWPPKPSTPTLQVTGLVTLVTGWEKPNWKLPAPVNPPVQLHTDKESMSPVAVASKVALPPEATEGGVNAAVQVGVGGQVSRTSSQTGEPPGPFGQVVVPGQFGSSGLGQACPAVQVGGQPPGGAVQLPHGPHAVPAELHVLFCVP